MNRIMVWMMTCAMLFVLAGTAFAQDKEQVDTRRWSIFYWQKMAEKGLVEVAKATPVPAAINTGSKIDALTVLIDDSPDVPVVNATDLTQSETSIFVNPLDNNKVLNSNNSTNFPVSVLYGTSGYFTTDGGATWGGSFQGTGGSNFGDPATAINLNGTYFTNFISLTGGQGAARSTDEGNTWQAFTVATSSGTDKNHMWVDNSPTSPFAGNLYVAYTDFNDPGANIFVTRSTDDAATWSSPQNISSAIAAGSHNQGVNVQTGPNGEVYATWAVYDAFPADEDAIGFAKSTDGGVTWNTASRIITNIRGIRNTGTSKNQRVNSFPSMAVDISGGAHNGWIYIVWANVGVPGVNQGPDIDVYMIRSTDGGATWSTPVRVNQDPTGQGKQHYFPWITCDPETGALSVIFYDDRNVTATQAEVFVANSVDGGSTWEDFKVSDVAFTPSPIPGLANGYFGDYIGISARGSKVYPVWTDNRTGNALAYVSPFVLADPLDPNPPANVTAYSDFTTPTSMLLTWDDPTTLVDGTPIAPGDFTIEIERDGVPLASVPGGTGTYTDMGLTDGQLYQYNLFTKLIINDSTSTVVSKSWYAGGSPTPAPPESLVCVAPDTQSAMLTWMDPTTQDDGTPLDDLDSIRVYRDGVHIASVAPGVGTYTDFPPPGFIYTYQLTAIDNESPVHESAFSNSSQCFVGSTPNFLVWVPPDVAGASAQSGDSLFAALVANGESAFLTNDLYEFGTDLSIYEGIFVVLGVFSNNHVLVDPEGTDLQNYLANGGRIYVEGADCFNFDPDVGGFDIRPWFDLLDGPDGSADVFGVLGINDLSGFAFPYQGDNSFMDELQPVTSTPIWQNDQNSDISGVFFVGYAGGNGRSIGVVPSFGGLVDNNNPLSPIKREVKPTPIRKEFTDTYRARPVRQENRNFVKKAAYYPELKKKRQEASKYYQYTAAGVKITANTKVDLMAAYLGLFRNTGAPAIGLSQTAFVDTLLVNETRVNTLTITNVGGSLAGDLTFFISENPDVSWLDVSPLAGTLAGNQSQDISLTLDATGLPSGSYSTMLDITSNDTANPVVHVSVDLVVNSAPIIGFFPDSLSFTMDPDQVDSMVMTITNTGAGPLDFLLDDEDVIGARILRVKHPKQPTYSIDTPKDYKDTRPGRSPALGAGGPDLFGHKWIDSDEPGGPVFNWIDITAMGTPVTLGDDDGIQVPLPFTFNFYGTDYTDIAIGSNGYLTFGSDWTDFSNDPIPDPNDPNDIIAPFWDDLNPGLGGTIHYYFDAATNQFIVQYTDIQHFGGSAPYTFEVILNSNGQILFQYLSMQGDLLSSTVGIENFDASDGLEVVFNAAYLHDNLAVRIAADSPWLSENPIVGTVPAGGSMDIQVIANTTGLLGGPYDANVLIHSNDPVTPDTSMPVHLFVTGIPDIDASTSMQFPDSVFVGDSVTQTLTISNVGNLALDVTDITSDNPVFSVSPTAFSVPPFGSQDVDVTFTPDVAGTHTGTLSIVSNDPDENPFNVSVSGGSVNPPIISVTPDSLTVGVAPGDSTDVTLTISNIAATGAANLVWSAKVSMGLPPLTAPNHGTPATEDYPVGSYEPSFGPAPQNGQATGEGPEASPATFPGHAWSIEEANGFITSFDLAVPEVLPNLAPDPAAGFDNAGDFGVGDQSFFYVLDNLNNFMTVDTSTFATTMLGTPAPISGSQSWTGMAVDPTDGTIYAVSCDIATTDLYTLDPGTGTASLVGSVGSPCIIAIAIDGNGDMWGYDIVNDDFLSIDKTTGAGTSIGPLGFDANFGQGMSWDPVTDQVFLAAFNNGTFQPELRVADLTTGNTTFLGVLGQNDPGGLNQLAFLAIPGGGSPFITLLPPTSGTIGPGDSQVLTARVFGLDVPDTTYFATIEISSNDPATVTVLVPVTVDVLTGITQVQNLVPTTFAVTRNYPNPFNPSTTINFQIPKSSDVSLVIYNVLGQKVRTLVNKSMETGYYKVTWDGHNDQGAQVASGIYIYRFKAGDYQKDYKMILLK